MLFMYLIEQLIELLSCCLICFLVLKLFYHFVYCSSFYLCPVSIPVLFVLKYFLYLWPLIGSFALSSVQWWSCLLL